MKLSLPRRRVIQQNPLKYSSEFSFFYIDLRERFCFEDRAAGRGGRTGAWRRFTSCGGWPMVGNEPAHRVHINAESRAPGRCQVNARHRPADEKTLLDSHITGLFQLPQ